MWERKQHLSQPVHRTLALLRDAETFANRSLGGCWWWPWLKPAVLKMDHSANPTATHPQLWNRILSLLQETLTHALWFTLLRLPQRRRVGPCSSLPCYRGLLWALRLNSPVCLNPLPCLSTDGPDWENESALCFRLCMKLQPDRMPSSREHHSCLGLCRRSSDKNTIL